MENLVFTQLSVQEVRKMIREEVRTALQECQSTTQVDAENDLMTIEELAALVNMAVTSIYGLIRRRQIPHIKRGKRLIFEKTKIIEWLQSGRQNTVSDAKADARAYPLTHPK
jgi:excisionase family DNA binding protein